MGAAPSCPVSGCELEVDWTLRSSDDKYFGAHGSNLENFSAAFPFCDAVQGEDDEEGENRLINMTTLNSEALSVLLRFMHHVEQPLLDKVDPGVLLQVATAAETYGVFSAKLACRLTIKNRMKSLPAVALMYFSQYGYLSDADSVAKWIILNCKKYERQEIHMQLARPGLCNVLNAWEKYENLHRVHAASATREPPLPIHGVKCAPGCQRWHSFRTAVIAFIDIDPLSQSKNLTARIEQEQIRLGDCAWCLLRAEKWKKEGVVDGLDLDFRSFL